jgi:hypothetical protein
MVTQSTGTTYRELCRFELAVLAHATELLEAGLKRGDSVGLRLANAACDRIDHVLALANAAVLN